jgi:Rod binding domain-containing protein
MDVSSDIAAVAAANTSGLKNLLNNKPKDPKAIDTAAKEFESVFMAQMLEHMFDGVSIDPLSEGSEGEDVYKSWILQQYGKTIADAGGIGIADYVKRELLNLQEVPSGTAQGASVATTNMQGIL